MHRFFIKPENIQGDRVVFPPETTRQILRVLHLRSGDRVMVLDNLGSEFQVRIQQTGFDSIEGMVERQNPVAAEPSISITLFPALCQREKFEWILQKCTEIGVSAFTPIKTARSLVPMKDEAIKKYDRWRKILQEAAEQSGRGRIPRLDLPLDYQVAVDRARETHSLTLFLWEGERDCSLSHVLQAWKGKISGYDERIALFIGPEGGFTEEEAAIAVKAGAVSVTLGARILRMETAAMIGSALVLHHFNQLG